MDMLRSEVSDKRGRADRGLRSLGWLADLAAQNLLGGLSMVGNAERNLSVSVGFSRTWNFLRAIRFFLVVGFLSALLQASAAIGQVPSRGILLGSSPWSPPLMVLPYPQPGIPSGVSTEPSPELLDWFFAEDQRAYREQLYQSPHPFDYSNLPSVQAYDGPWCSSLAEAIDARLQSGFEQHLDSMGLLARIFFGIFTPGYGSWDQFAENYPGAVVGKGGGRQVYASRPRGQCQSRRPSRDVARKGLSGRALARRRADIAKNDGIVDYYKIGGDASRAGQPRYHYDPDPATHGEWWVYLTRYGHRALVRHSSDPEAKGPHWHAAAPPEGGKFTQRGQEYEQIGDKHHFYDWDVLHPRPQ